MSAVAVRRAPNLVEQVPGRVVDSLARRRPGANSAWQRTRSPPREQVEAARVLVRTCEGLLANLSEAGSDTDA